MMISLRDDVSHILRSEVTMCTFSSGQLEIMIDAFWNLDGVLCPRDGAEIEPHLYPQREGYLLVLACPAAAQKHRSPAIQTQNDSGSACGLSPNGSGWRSVMIGKEKSNVPCASLGSNVGRLAS